MPTFGNIVNGSGFAMQGPEAMKARLRKAAKRIPEQLIVGMSIEMEVERDESEQRTPILTGALRSTLRVEGPFFEGKRIFFKLLAGSEEVFYAWIVHEDLEAHHDIGDAKYIESVLMESAPHMAARIGRHFDLRRAVS